MSIYLDAYHKELRKDERFWRKFIEEDNGQWSGNYSDIFEKLESFGEHDCSSFDGVYFRETIKIRGRTTRRYYQYCRACGKVHGAISKGKLKYVERSEAVTHEDVQRLKDEWHDDKRKTSDTIREQVREYVSYLSEQAANQHKREYTKYLQSTEWRAIREKVLERDGYICQGCLANRATDIHHKTYERLYGEMCFDLVAVCRSCHGKIHNRSTDEKGGKK